MENNQVTYQPPMQVSIMAERLNLEPSDMHNVVLNTVMPANKPVSDAQFISFMAVANEYKLNPLTKEIYAFPTKGGGIQPIVSIDGWLKIINSHRAFDGMAFHDQLDSENKLFAVTCKIYRTDRKHPVEVTEYLVECQGPTEDKYKNKTPWGKFPARMLRHKATIQAARYAFGLSGIIDPDEAERFEDAGVIVKDITPEQELITEVAEYSEDDFNKNFPKWEKVILSGKKTAEGVFATLDKNNIILTDEQITKINGVK